jgi:hypothetical protein
MLWRQSNRRMHQNDALRRCAADQLLIEFVSDHPIYRKPSAQFINQPVCDAV